MFCLFLFISYLLPRVITVILMGNVLLISHQNLHHYLENEEESWIESQTEHFLNKSVILPRVCCLNAHRVFSLCWGWHSAYLRGISLILPSVLSMAPRSISVCCCCVLSLTNKTRHPPPPNTAAFHHCLVPAMNRPNIPNEKKKSPALRQKHLWEVSIVLASPPATMNSMCVLVLVSNTQSICANASSLPPTLLCPASRKPPQWQ